MFYDDALYKSTFYLLTYLLTYQLAFWFIQPFGHNRHGPKIGGCAPLGGGAGSPSNTVWPRSRPTSVPSDILIRPAVWPHTWAEKWAWAAVPPPLFGGGAGSPSNTIWRSGSTPILHAKIYLDPSNRLATVHQRYRQTEQRSDSVGRTV